jgi:senataxin
MHDVKDGSESSDGTSIRNVEEAVFVGKLAKTLKKEQEGSVVLITPYSSQVSVLIAQRSGCEVHTVDSFQGREADIVVLSCVRDGTRGLGFVDDDRRMTVALSRARKRLEIVASKTDMWPRESVVRRVMDMI